MAEQNLKLTYNPAHMRVRIELTPKICGEELEPPEGIFERATKRLEIDKKKGRIDYYQIHKKVVEDVWALLRQNKFNLEENESVALTLASGVPRLNGLKVAPPNNPDDLCQITISGDPKDIEKWRLKWLLTDLKRQLDGLGIEGVPHKSQLRNIRNTAAGGRKIENMALGKQPTMEMANSAGGKPYNVIADQRHQIVSLVVFDLEPFLSEQRRQQLVKMVAKYAKNKFDAQGVVEQPILDDLELAASGIERYGFRLPVVSFVGRLNTKKQPVDGYPGKGLLQITPSPDRLKAQITGFKPSFFNDKSITFDMDWLKRELERLGVVMIDEAGCKRIAQKFARSQDPNNLVCAEGKPGQPASEPYLVVHEPKEEAVTAKTEGVDVRQGKMEGVYRSGALVAEVKYRTEAKFGEDIFGEICEPPAPQPHGYKAGDGVKQIGLNKFFATTDGKLKDGESAKVISVLDAYVHEGDVNLTSGDLEFDGSLIINGTVRSNATVVATGDVTIEGSVEGGRIFAGGNVKISGGVTTSLKNWIRCGGNFHCQFLDNSNVFCGGTVSTDKNIVGSNVYSLKDIFVKDGESILGGSNIYVWGELSCANIGFPNGRETYIYMGVDGKKSLGIEVLKRRIESLSRTLKQLKADFGEMVRKSAAQLTAAKKERKEKMSKDIKRLKDILARLEQRLEIKSHAYEINLRSAIKVKGTLTTTTTFIMGERNISPETDLIDVLVKPAQDPKHIFTALSEKKAS